MLSAVYKIWCRVVIVCFALLAAACVDTFVAPDRPNTNARLFDELWSSVDLHYSFFDLKGINWDSLRTVYRPRAISATDPDALFETFDLMLQELRDPHVTITAGDVTDSRYRGRSDTVPQYYYKYQVLKQYFSDSATGVDSVRSELYTKDLGYVQIDNFDSGLTLDKLDAALDKLSGAPQIIVDARGNYGGNYALAVHVAGRFVQNTATFGTLRLRNGPKHSDFSPPINEVVTPEGRANFRGNIYLLTDAGTVSAGEVFVLAMRTNRNVITVGDTTGGASGGPTARELSNGWFYNLSEWIEFTPLGRTFEGVGLPPDVYFKATLNNTRRADPVFELAVQLASQPK